MRGSDVVVVGAGVFGLWCALACARAGLSVTLADAARPGAGASGGPVGALAPADPRRWTALAAFQREGLLALPGRIAALEAETGRATGYVRTGRVTALHDAAARDRLAAQIEAAEARWGALGRLSHRAAPVPGLVRPPEGWAEDTATARIDPPRYLAVLSAALGNRVRRLDSWRLMGAGPGRAVFDQGTLPAGTVVLTAGWRSGALAGIPVAGVKGQAALLAADLPAGMPVVTGPGLYIVRHGPRRVAVGSTVERDWTCERPDALLDAVIARAGSLCPALRGAPVVRRWAGIRPRAPDLLPMVGPLPGRPALWVATGARGIGFALAHLAGEAVAAAIAGTAPEALPPEILPETQLRTR